MNSLADTLARLPYIDQDSDEWLTLTKGKTSLFSVTASTAAEIVGVSPYNSPYRRWQLDSGLIQDIPNPRSIELRELGKQDEPFGVAAFEEYWRKATNCTSVMWVDKTGTWPHPKYPWLAASPDRRLYFPFEKAFDLLEVKSRQGDSIPEPPTDSYYIQMQVQLACVPLARGCWFFSHNRSGEHEPVARYVERDTALFENTILPALVQHVRRVETGEAPPKRQTDKPYTVINASKAKHIYTPGHAPSNTP